MLSFKSNNYQNSLFRFSFSFLFLFRLRRIEANQCIRICRKIHNYKLLHTTLLFCFNRRRGCWSWNTETDKKLKLDLKKWSQLSDWLLWRGCNGVINKSYERYCKLVHLITEVNKNELYYHKLFNVTIWIKNFYYSIVKNWSKSCYSR